MLIFHDQLLAFDLLFLCHLRTTVAAYSSSVHGRRAPIEERNNSEGSVRTHLSTHFQCRAIKLHSCCFPRVKLQGESAKLRQELGKLM